MKLIWTKLPVALLCCFALNSCGTATSWHTLDETYKWGSSERAGLPRQRLLPQFLDSKSKQGESFYQYYFIQEPSQSKDSNYDDKTILFCAGGPGRNPMLEMEKDDNFLAGLPGYRVVYFHIRGSGFSQIPESNKYDHYLKSRYVVEDMEFIRQKILGDKRWAAVVGYSYGTVLAQQYAYEHPAKLNKLILAAPMSRHQFSAAASANKREEMQPEMLEQMRVRETQLRHEMREKDMESLKEILARDDFNVLQMLIDDRSVSLVDFVPRVVRTVLEDVDVVAGSLPLLNDAYAELQKDYDRLDPKGKREQYKNLFEYSAAFFRALRKIRDIGWVPGSDTKTTSNQDRIATIVLNEVLQHTKGISLAEKLKTKLELAKYEKHLCDLRLDFKTDQEIKKMAASAGVILVPLNKETNRLKTYIPYICEGPRILADVDNEGSGRVFDVMSFYDGLNTDVLIDIRPNDEPGGSNLISRISRRKPLLGRRLTRIGRSLYEEPKAWNPAEFKHGIPTLIIKGGADPVPVGGAADYIYDSGLMTQEKLLLEFPGIGHYLNLQETSLRGILKEQNGRWNDCELDLENKTLKNTRTCLIGLFLNDSLHGQNRDQLLEAIGLELKCRVENISKKTPAISGLRARSGNEPYRTILVTKSCDQAPI